MTWNGGDLTTGQLVVFRNLASGTWDMTGNGATLNVTLINGFLPALGDNFQIINYASRIGAFARVNGLSLAGTGLRLDPVYNATGLMLVTTNEPALTIQRQGSDVLVSWPTAFSDWTLQLRTNLAAPEWIPLAPPGTNSALFRPVEFHRYFRLIK